MVHHLRIQANALRQAAAESQTDPLLMTMMLETAGELEAFADQVEAKHAISVSENTRL
jgi:hypothetical protein